MQNLQTVILNCNNLTTLQGLENLPSLRAIVLDHNRIRDVPFNCLAGCKSLKYLHLEHNRIANLPRLPHLTNLTALYLAYNKIQSLTDLNPLAGTGVTELSMAGNPLATRSDYRLNVAARLAQLSTLDGKDLTCERQKLSELANKWFPGSTVIRDPVYRERELQQGSPKFNSLTSLQTTENDFSLRIKPLSSHMCNNSPRSLQYPGYKSKLRPG
jgi:Leucine-rich repeat (LRR) protein